MKKELGERINYVKENYKWLIAVSTFVGVIMLNVLKFAEYLRSNLYFCYYGIDISLYKFEDKNILYELGMSIILFLMTFSVLYCIKQTFDKIKNKFELNLSDLLNVIIIFAYNSIFIIKYSNDIETYCALFLFLLIVEFIGSLLIFSSKSSNIDDEKKLKEMKNNRVKLIPFLIVLFIFSLSIVYLAPIMDKKKYRIINDNKVIVYTTNDYYLVLNCEIIGNKLIIYKGTQEKIDNVNVNSIYKEFEQIEFK